MATITSLTFQIFSRYDGGGLRRARRDIDDFDNSTKRSTNNLNSWSGRIELAVAAATSFGPALVPLGAGLVAVAGGLAASSAAAAGAAGVWGVALRGAVQAIDNTNTGLVGLSQQLGEAKKVLAEMTPGTDQYGKQLKEVNKLQDEYNHVVANATPAQKAFLDATQNLTTAWGKFIGATQGQTLSVAARFINALAEGVGKLAPLVSAVTPLANGLATAFQHWVDTKLDGWINLLKSNGVPALQEFITIGKNVATVLGDGFRAFLPLGQQLIKVLAEGSSNLKAWADGGGFQKFLQYVHDNGPAIKDFFSALGGALKSVGSAFSGMAPQALLLSTALLQIIGAMPPGVIQAIADAWLLWKSAMQGMMIVQAISSGIAALSAACEAAGMAAFTGGGGMTAFAASLLGVDAAALPLIATIGLVVLALAAVAIGIYELVTHWSTVWGAMKTAAEAVWQALQVAWQATVSALSTAWQAVSSAMVTAWNATWNGLKTAGEAVWNALKVAWGAVASAFATAWSATASAITTAWNATWNGLKTAAEAVWNALKTAWQAVATAFTTAWQAVSGALTAAWSAFWNALKTAAEAVWNALKTAWQTFIQGLQQVWQTVSSALTTAWQTFWNALKTAAQTVWNAMKTAWDAFLNAVKTVWTTVSNALKTAWQTFWNALKTAAQTVWNAMKTAWQTFLNGVRTIWNTVSNALKSAWQTFWNAIKSAAQTVWDGIKKLWQTFLDGVKSIWDTFSSTVKKLWSDFWDGLGKVASSAWDKIKSIVTDAVNAVIDVINGIANGIESIAEKVGLHLWGKNPVPHVGGGGGGGGGGGSTAPGGTTPGGGFAKGGIVGGGINQFEGGGVLGGYSPGNDTVTAALSPGEGILVPEAVAGLGAGFVHAANYHFSNGRGGKAGFSDMLPGFAAGGIVSGLGGVEAWHRSGPNPGWSFAAGGVLPSEIPAPDPSHPGQTSGTVGQTPGKNPGGAGTSSSAGLSGIGIPGVGDLGGAVLGFIGRAAFETAINALLGPLNAFNQGGDVGKIPVAAAKKVAKSAIDWFAKKDSEAKASYESHAVAGAQSVQAWRALAIQAMKMGGIDPSQIDAFLLRMQIESSGNPNAINTWDINAKNGIPSQGLMQIIPPNFSKYHVAGTSNNILDPLANMAAAAAYIRAVYGGRVPTGAAYASGTAGATSGWALVGEQGPEMINFRGGEGIDSNHELSKAIRGGGHGGGVHVSMPISVAGNLDKAAVEKLDSEVIPKLRIMLSKGTGSRLT
jgi:phage-related protein